MIEKKIGYSTKQHTRIWIFVGISIIIKFILYYHFFAFYDGDKMLQAVAGLNFLEGNGLTTTNVDPNDFGILIYTPLKGWPPGYSLMFAFIQLFTGNMIATALVIDLVSVILFFLILRIILINLLIKTSYIYLLLLSQSLAIKSYVIYSTSPVELLSATFIFYSCYLISRETYYPNKAWLVSIINVLPGLLRYLYLPLIFVAPLFLYWNGIIKKQKHLKEKGIFSFISSILFLIGLILFEKFYKGEALYLASVEKGIFISNLKALYPFMVDSFINLDLIIQLLVRLTNFSYPSWMSIFRILNAAICLTFFYFFIAYLWKTKFISKTFSVAFIHISGVYSVIIVTVLLLLSIINGTDFGFGFIWTYVVESRYFLFLTILLPILAAFYLFKIKSDKLKLLLQVIFVFLLLFQIFHGAYYSAKHIFFREPKQFFNKPENDVKAVLKTQIPLYKEKGFHVLVSSKYLAFPHYGNLLGATGLFDINLVLLKEMKASRPTIIFLILYENELQYFQDFINNEKTILIEQSDDIIYCFVQEIKASTTYKLKSN